MRKVRRSLFCVFCAVMIVAATAFFPACVRAEAETAQDDGASGSGAVSDGGGDDSEVVPDGGPAIGAVSGVLMEAETGTVIFGKAADERLSPASVTKVMTLLLIFDALEEGSLKLTDTVTTSARAKSMGGSQVFLEEGETQDAETMIKCIVISSGNDASVAMAEHLAGSEEEFVRRMNERAAGLGMKNTHFEDCCGLTDSDNHYTTARDIALMSRELIVKHPKVLEYSSIWMENITHVTRKGSSEFGLSNTNKLVRTYDGCVGLKTGSTSKAKFCLSAVAQRNGITLISVVMASPDSKTRLKDASSLLDYGFGRCTLYKDEKMETLPKLPVERGVKGTAALTYEKEFRCLSTDGNTFENVEKKLVLPEKAAAPVKEGEQAGELIYLQDGKELGRVAVLYGESVAKAGYGDSLRKVADIFFDKHGEAGV